MSIDAAPHYRELEPRQRRRLLLLTTLRAAVTVTVLVVLYYTLPLDRPLDRLNALWFLTGFLVFAAAVAWQVYAIIRSPYPRLRAIEAFSVVVPVFLLMFAGTYYLLETDRPGSFTMPLTRTDALYFTVTVFVTVGFGDIAATTAPSRILVTVQMVAGLALVGVVARLIVSAVQINIQRMTSGTPPKEP
ncbi:potassium channel family protein [Streptomyces xiamenensis]